ncbi:hypothetical protein M413DRAFT_22142 [Hebeloma cylindrosporum]|uniref:Fork-head domain-containing protein n=1 Tax=Hebeloma cylindrosporum TaxID=76867 RepID=A0A0C2Z2J6_HEBCY|nr:hypothetical protein M413DRAFT_22142 [Hebeloma cylindrosporum h7]
MPHVATLSTQMPDQLTIETEPVRFSDDEGEDEISPESDDDEVDELESDYGNYDEPSPPVSVPAGGGVITQTSSDENKGLLAKISLIEKKAPSVPPVKPPRRKLEKHDRRIDLGLHDHQAHADCPDTLACLPDTQGRPQHTLPVILRCAILGSPRKRLTIREIYATMESKYPFYKSAGETWKQSVRHHLSLNRLFERQPRPVTDPGFGSYWTVNLDAPPGTKRPRKRGRPNKEGDAAKKATKAPGSPQPTKYQFQPQTHPAPPPPPLPQPQVNTLSPRATHQPQPQPMAQSQTTFPQVPPHAPKVYQQRPHRSAISPPVQQQPSQQQQRSQRHPNHPPPLPPLPPLPQPSQQQHHRHHQSHHNVQPHPMQRTSPPSPPPPPPPIQQPNPARFYSGSRQQPQPSHKRKSSTPMTPVSGRGSDYPPSSKESETEDGGPMTHEEDNSGPIISDDDANSDEDMDRGYKHRQSHPGAKHTAFVPTKPSPIFSLPPFSALGQTREDVIEHMRQEIATLRRTSAEAVSTSIRLTEQLANANLEVSRSREAVRDLEDMLAG